MKKVKQLFLISIILVIFGVRLDAKRPNILFILSDDQRADAIAAYGHPDIKTPHLDRLVKDGVSFHEAYCMGANSGAVCAPSRAMIMTGRPLFNIHGSYLVPWSYPEGERGISDTITMPEFFRKNGYTTFMTGKWHQDAPTFITGFDAGKNLFMTGMGSHTNVKIWDFDPTGQAYGKDDFRIVDGFSSTLFANAAVDYLKNYNEEKSFFMYVAFTAPHDPRTPPEENKAEYDAAKLSIPENHLKYHPFNQGELKIRDEYTEAFPRTKKVVQGALSDYYAMITQMDEQVGRIIAALKKSGEYENTYIVFASDHGLAIGSHGLMGKQNLYTHSMRAPLIISGPGIHGRKDTDEFVYLYDIFPTLVDLTGLTIPDDVQGISLKDSLTQSGKRTNRPYLFNAYKDSMRAISTEDWKFIRYPKLDKSQLFDRKNDPHEINDLASNPKYAAIMSKMSDMLRDAQLEFNDDLSWTAENVVSAKYEPETFFKKKK